MKHMEYPNPDMAEKIAQVVYDSGLTQSEVGEVIGRDRKVISAWINCWGIPNAVTLAKFCQHFNVSADWLLGLTKENKPIREVLK